MHSHRNLSTCKDNTHPYYIFYIYVCIHRFIPLLYRIPHYDCESPSSELSYLNFGMLLTTADLLLGRPCISPPQIAKNLLERQEFLSAKMEQNEIFGQGLPNNTVFLVMPLDYLQVLSGALRKETWLELFVRMTEGILWKVFQKEFWTTGSCTVIWDSFSVYISIEHWMKQINFKIQRSLYSPVLLGTDI